MLLLRSTLRPSTLVPLVAAALATACAGGDADTFVPVSATGGQGHIDSGSGGSTIAAGGASGGSSASEGGSGGSTLIACAETSSHAKLENLPADLVVVVDNSDSMALEAAQVKSQINTMVGALAATGVDAHVVIISDDSKDTIFNPFETGVCVPAPLGSGACPADENLPGYRHVVQHVGSNNALETILATHAQWKQSLRANASLTFLVVSDDNASMGAATFKTALSQLNPPIVDFKFNAITASNGPASCALCAFSDCGSCSNPCCDQSLSCLPISAKKGKVYEELQGDMSGIYGDLCTQNFAPVFADMATAIISHTEISCQFEIPAPSEGVLVPGETNVEFFPAENAKAQPVFNVPGKNDCTINGGWFFDNNSTPTEIFLCETTCTAVKQSTKGEMTVKYGCATQTGPK